ncbi:hypothetical protein TYRP_008759 [Tyrophagus putrescentiae]|nr:hypothetical protein TYRP_008759 [Tyrophagus putrescentiae]
MLLTRFGLLLLFLALHLCAYSTAAAAAEEDEEGFCTTADCPQVMKKRRKEEDQLRETEVENEEEGEHNDHSSSLYTGAYLDRSVELLRTEDTFFAHLFEESPHLLLQTQIQLRNSSSSSPAAGNLEYRCPGLLFSFNAVYLPHCPALETSVLKDDDDTLPSPAYSLATAPVTSIALEPYFGIPTPTSLSILVARFEHDLRLPCDQISPLGLTTTSDQGLDPQKEVAILVGNGLESRRVRLADLAADGERFQPKKDSTSAAAADK